MLEPGQKAIILPFDQKLFAREQSCDKVRQNNDMQEGSSSMLSRSKTV